MKTLYVSVLLFCVGCRDINEVAIRSQYPQQTKILVEATEQLTILLKQDKLPGITSKEHGHLQSLPMRGESVPYPRTVTFRMEKENQPAQLLFYTLQKNNKESPWVLTQAWREDKQKDEKVDLMELQKNPSQ